jgi:hypothetical protein
VQQIDDDFEVHESDAHFEKVAIPSASNMVQKQRYCPASEIPICVCNKKYHSARVAKDSALLEQQRACPQVARQISKNLIHHI